MKTNKTLKIFSSIISIVLIVLFVCMLVYFFQTKKFNSTIHTISRGNPVRNNASVQFKERGAETDSWIKRDVYVNGKTADFTGIIYEASVTNEDTSAISDWTLKYTATSDCYINSAWCGLVELYQNVGTENEKTQTIDFRNYVYKDITLDNIYDGVDLMVHLNPGDYFIYHPSVEERETPISGSINHSGITTVGFIFYFDNKPQIGNYEVKYQRSRSYSLLSLKHFALCIYFIVLFIQIYLFIGAASQKKSKLNYISNAFAVIIFSILSHISLILFDSRLIAKISYIVFFLSIDWALLFLFLYILNISETNRKTKIMTLIGYVVMILDSINIISGFFTDKLFNIVQIIGTDNDLYYIYTPRYMFNLHLISCYFTILATMVLIIYRCIGLARIYRIQYLSIIVSLIIIVVLDAVFLIDGSYLNLTVIGYTFICLLNYHAISSFIPASMAHRIISMVTGKSKDMIFFFDRIDNCIYISDYAKNFFEINYKNKDTELEVINKKLNTDITLVETEPFMVKFENSRNFKFFDIEIKSLNDTKGKYLGKVLTISDNTENIIKIEEERYKANHDSLTDAYNEDYFYVAAREVLDNNPDKDFYMIVSNIRNFKLINELIGWDSGDSVLTQISILVKKNLRENDVFGRLYADHFCLLIPKEHFETSIFINVSDIIENKNNNYKITLQIQFGIYEIIDKSIPVHVMIDHAKMALEPIKDRIFQRFSYYDDNMRQQNLLSQRFNAEFEDAVKNDEFIMYLQPQINCDDKICGAEMLVRWNHPDLGLLSPSKFLPIFEKNGLIAKLDYIVWENACKTLKKWQEKNIDLHISVNISATDFLVYNIADVFTELVEKYKIPSNRLHLEITETYIMENLTLVLNSIEILHNKGFIVEMDDFGAGYSSLNTLKNIPVDVIKMDMLFLQVDNDVAKSYRIIKTILDLAKDLDVKVISEGVENKEQMDFLKENGTTLFQGYYFSKPIAVKDFEDIYLNL